MSLPLVINPGDLGHISDHEEAHSFLAPIVSPFTLAQDAQGLLADRPAAGTRGRLYFATDDSTLYRDSGTAWAGVYTMLKGWTPSLLNADASLTGFKTPSVSAFKSVAQSLTDSVTTVITFTSEDFDNDGMHSISSNTGRLTAVRAGIYLVGAYVGFDSNATGYRRIVLRKNATDVIAADTKSAVSGVATHLNAMGPVQLSATDYVDVTGVQTSGIALSVTTGKIWAALISTL